MKRKSILVALLAMALVLGALFVYADGEVTPQWFTDMLKWKTERIDQAVVSGDITEEQALDFKARLEEMAAYHEENGFDYPMGKLGKGSEGRFCADGERPAFDKEGFKGKGGFGRHFKQAPAPAATEE